MEHRVLVVGLDGWDHGLEEHLQSDGHLPNLARLAERSARFLIDPQGMQLDGLDWEHFLAGVGPEATHRACAVDFDPRDYASWQRSAGVTPFLHALPIRSVVLDLPYCDLTDAPSTQGVVGWAASDPGIDAPQAHPDTLFRWIDSTVGPYPATDWLDTISWPSAEVTEEMGRRLVRGVATRSDVAGRLLTERIPDWDLAMVVVTETHTAAEAFWHGVDPGHPLHRHPSARPAADALRDVYAATDRMVGELVERTGADQLVVLALNGMASNRFDVPTMVLLPELLLRWSCGEQLLTVPDAWSRSPGEVPILDPDGPSWTEACAQWLGAPQSSSSGRRSLLGRARARLADLAPKADRRPSAPGPDDHRISLEWHPAMRYQPSWPRMRAFALPSFAAGHIRVNVEGRERDGVVAPSDYGRVCDELEELLRSCTNPATGTSVVQSITRADAASPHHVDDGDPDLRVTWAEGVCALDHVDLGLVGPVPIRRTGDHMGARGFVNVAGDGITPGDRGVGTVFDLAPTIAALVCGTSSAALRGRDLLATDQPTT